MVDAERDRVAAGFGRLEDGLRQARAGSGERSGGMVREDYRADSGACDYLLHDASPVPCLPVG